MALVVFESRVDMLTVATPSIGGFVVAYDTLDGILKQKDDQGVITAIAGSTPVGSLAQTLEVGNSTGTYSINLGSNCKLGSLMGGGQLRLDNGIGGANIVNLSTDYGVLAQSYLYMSSGTLILKSLNASISFSPTIANFQLNSSNNLSFSNSSYYVTVNSVKSLTFTTATSSTNNFNTTSALISTRSSNLGLGVYNTVVLGGIGITGATSNSVYAPNLYVQDGGFIKGTTGSGMLKFDKSGDVILSNNNSIIGVISSTSSFTQNGIFIKDSATASTTPNINTGITYISTKNSSATASIKNSVIIGGQNIIATHDNTVYLGNNVNINNSFTLPNYDGSIGQIIKTDGSGNTYWGSSTGAVIEITALDFFDLGGTFGLNTTYKILDADVNLYGGTEIYLTTNSSGVLSDNGVGKFYTPLYDQGVDGFNIYATSSSYGTGDITIWGGVYWIRNSTYNLFTYPVDMFTLNTTYWNAISFNDPYSYVYYNINYDEIKYDWVNDLIIYRNEKNINIVSTNKMNIDMLDDSSLYNPIKVFQWGNVYNYSVDRGIGQQIINNSYNENINFIGKWQRNIRFYNGSIQNNCLFVNTSSQSNINLDNYIWDRTGQTIGTESDLFLNGNRLSYQVPVSINASTNVGKGEIVFFGDPSTVLNPGFIYQFSSTGEWVLANNALESESSGLLAIALGTSTTVGLLTKGYATFDLSPYGAMTLGSTIYLSTSGTFDQIPTSTSTQIVRVIGYCIDTSGYAGILYFCPDTTWIEIV